MDKPEFRDVYAALVAAGCQIDNHESDLYVKADETSRRIIRESGWYCSSFRNQIDGTTWFDLPFAFAPFWNKRQRGNKS